MAEILAALLSKVVDLLAEGAQRHISAVASVEDELRKLEIKLKAIQPILEDAHDKQFTSGRIKDWISRVHDIICDAEDIIDLYKAKTRYLDAQTRQGKVRRQLSSLSFMCRNFLFMHKTASEIKEVTERLHSVYEQKTNLGLFPLTTRSGPPQDQIELLSRNRLTTSNITEQKTFGREKDEELVVEWLKKSLNNETEQNIDVVAIVGMGGLGKTTLAKKVYHNSSIRGHFEKLMWICASERPQLRELYKQILEELRGKGSCANEIIGLNALNLEIAKHLKEKRFLVVMDDVWDRGWWRELNGLLKEGAQGSRVLITTKEGAEKMDATYLHRLKCLSSASSCTGEYGRKDYCQEGNHVYRELDVHEAYWKFLKTWAKWMVTNVDPKKTLTLFFFRGYSSSDFSGGQWNSGGQGDNETERITKNIHFSSLQWNC